jgi:ubiquinone/menaquinone biosynthesis C-methylase UbiE/rRNA maturation protein Nop10
MKYIFKEIDKCNMCGADTSTHKVLGKRLNKSQGKNPKRKLGITTTVCECTNCGLIYSNPQPIPFDIQDHYGVFPEEYWKESYFELNDNYFQGEISRLKQLMDFNPGMKSLDIGAGLGKQMISLQKAGFDAYSFEPSKPFFERAVSKMGISPDKLKLGMIEEVDYDENSFDFVSFGAVLEHLYDPSASIKKALKWTKPNGLIHVEVPSSEWLTNKIINLFYKLRFSDYVGNISPMHEPYHLYEFGLDSYRENAKTHNYTIAHYEFYVCQTFLPKILDGIIKSYMKRTNQGMQLCVWLRKTPHNE